jgi:DNA-binding FadR family transcriptional regulator
MIQDKINANLSEFLQYLASHEQGEQSLPALTALSQELGISVASLREQLEVARALGFVEVRPRIGIRRQPYSFTAAVRQSLKYALALDKNNFTSFADLRRHIETTYWFEAICLLTEEDHAALKALVEKAWKKLRGSPIEIPHPEHRELHLTVYHRLHNPFVTGLLTAYWDAYEMVGLNFFTDYNYLTEVWTYHQKMVDAICSNDAEAGFIALTEHSDLINQLLSSANQKSA